jgi:hypothetical protein
MIGFVILGSILRIASAFGELWLDEMWSLVLISTASSPLDLVYKVRHDNNHLLNSLWMWSLPFSSPSWLYRLPAVASSIALLMFVNHASTLVQDAKVRAVWCLFCASSFPLVLLGSEARGYALAILCSVACVEYALRIPRDPHNPRPAIIFAIAATVGCFTHAIFAIPLGVAIVLLVLTRSDGPEATSASNLWIALGPPLVVGAALSLMFYCKLAIGGGPELPFAEVAITTLRLAFGLPERASDHAIFTDVESLIATGACIISICGIRSWIRSYPQQGLVISVILCAPVLLVLIAQPQFIMGRYVAIQIAFLYLVTAHALVTLSARGSAGRMCAASLIVLFVFGSLRLDLGLIRDKRSHFVETIQNIQSTSESELITLGGDQDYQNELRCRYVKLHQSPHSCPTYVRNYINASEGPNFILRETLPGMSRLPGELSLQSGATYSLIAVRPAPPWSGATTYLYQRH